METKNNAINEIIKKLALFLGQTGLDPSQDLFAIHVLDSVELESLLLFVEENYGIKIFLDDIKYANFHSLISIARYIYYTLRWEAGVESLTIDTVLGYQAISQGNKEFLKVVAENEAYTFRELDYKTAQIASWLDNLDIRKGDRVGLVFDNTGSALLFYFGCLRAGIICVPIDPSHTVAQITKIIKHSNMVALASDGHRINELATMVHPSSLVKSIINLSQENINGNSISLLEGWEDTHETYLLGMGNGVFPEDIAVILYTSGTTGSPKGVVLTHKNILVNSYWIGNVLNLAGERLLCVLSLYHTNGQIINILSPLLWGGCVVLTHPFNLFSGSTFWDLINKYSITVVDVVPTILVMLLKREIRAEIQNRSLKFIMCGAASLPLDLQKRFEETYDCKIVQEYGLTECTCVASLDSPNNRRLGSIGKALPCNEIKIVNDDLEELPIGQMGQLVIRGQNVMKEYYLMPKLSTEVIKDGWLLTGDLGKIDGDGYIFIQGRIKDIIIKGGVTIYPYDIDNVLSAHPAITESATVSIPDEVYGEEIKSFIVLKPGETLDKQTIKDFCKGQLSQYYIPKHIEFISSLPKTISGKVKTKSLL